MHYKRLLTVYLSIIVFPLLSGTWPRIEYQWTALGPFETPESTADSGDWTGTGLGWFECIHYDKRNDVLYAGSISNGLFRSNDQGRTWTQMLASNPQMGVFDMLVKGKEIFIATGQSHFDEDFGLGVLRTRNKGKSWKATGLRLEPFHKTNIWGIELCLDNKTMTAISSDNIWLSPKKARNWDTVYTGQNLDLRQLLASAYQKELIFASGRRLLVSRNKGKNWQDITDSLSVGKKTKEWNTQRIALAEDPNIPGRMLAAYQYNGYVWIDESQDFGNSWNNIHRTRSVRRFDKNHAEIAIAPGNSNMIVLGSVRLYISTGKKIDFTASTFPNYQMASFAHDDIRSLIVLNSNTILIGTDGGVFKSMDGGKTWKNLSGRGLNASMIYGIGISERGIFAGFQDLGTMQFNNGKWTNLGPVYGDGGDAMIYGNQAYLMSNGRPFVYDLDNKKLNFDNLPSAGMTPFTAHYVHSPSLKDTFYFIADHLWRFDGTGWKNMTSGLENKGYKASCFTFNARHHDILYFAFDQPSWGNPLLARKFFKSMDGGQTWEDISSNLPLLNWKYVSSVVTNPDRPREVYVSLGMMDEDVVHKVYRSEDAGETWSNWSDGLSGLNSYRIRFIEGSESSVLVATQDGLYYRNNALPYWVPLDRGFPKIAIRDFELDYDNRKIYAGSYGSGLWLLEMSEDMWTL